MSILHTAKAQIEAVYLQHIQPCKTWNWRFRGKHRILGTARWGKATGRCMSTTHSFYYSSLMIFSLLVNGAFSLSKPHKCLWMQCIYYCNWNSWTCSTWTATASILTAQKVHSLCRDVSCLTVSPCAWMGVWEDTCLSEPWLCRQTECIPMTHNAFHSLSRQNRSESSLLSSRAWSSSWTRTFMVQITTWLRSVALDTLDSWRHLSYCQAV